MLMKLVEIICMVIPIIKKTARTRGRGQGTERRTCMWIVGRSVTVIRRLQNITRRVCSGNNVAQRNDLSIIASIDSYLLKYWSFFS